ncbi:hypothetical protein A3J41_03025 [candidate division TM6 bacterium RIFCSPHIGHO2_12_FULL_38_8]|nr:MAG: hypothetical protein A3J41_03025 [candidate division TM6 bacterium RIFCSPHIGHO2_12_FULL_38_8]
MRTLIPPVVKNMQAPENLFETSKQVEFLNTQKKSEEQKSYEQRARRKFKKSLAVALVLFSIRKVVRWFLEQEFVKEEEEELKELDKKAEARRTWNSLFYDKVSKVYPEVYGVFLKIKKDMGINEHVNLYLRRDTDACPSFVAFTSPLGDIWISESCIKIGLDHQKKCLLISTLAHELEYYKQFCGYADSKNWSLKSILFRFKDNQALMNIGADASAADYMYCSKCLKIMSLSRRCLLDYPEYSAIGYFLPKDYEIYRQRAHNEGALCPAHQFLFPGWLPDEWKPLRSFLPPEPK